MIRPCIVKNYLPAVWLLLLLPYLGWAQQQNVLHGKVFYDSDKKPVINAMISIANAPEYITYTNQKGEFMLDFSKDSLLRPPFQIQVSTDQTSYAFTADNNSFSSYLSIPLPREKELPNTETVTQIDNTPQDTTVIIPRPQNNTNLTASVDTEENTLSSEENTEEEILEETSTLEKIVNEDLPNKPQEDISDLRKDFEEITRRIDQESQNIITGSENIKRDILSLWERLKLKKNLSSAQRDTLRDFIKKLDEKIKEYSTAHQTSQNNVESSLEGIKQLLNYQEDQIRINQITIITLLSIIFGLTLLSYFFYWINKRTQRQKRILAENYKKINQQNEEINIQKEEIQHQRDSIRDKNRELEFAYTQIKDSVQYAERIQSAFLVNPHKLEQYFQDSFILHLPRDIVSGDFYWHSIKDDLLLLAVIDCTGHGVPGALMTIMANDALNQIVNEKNIFEPSAILLELDNRVKSALGHKLVDKSEAKDGMDLMIAQIDVKTKQVRLAGAGSTMYYVKNQEIHQVKGSKYIIGHLQNKGTKEFHENIIDFAGGEVLYFFSDGFQDQFGGDDDSKYLKRKFRDLLLTISHQPMANQYTRLMDEFNAWKGDNSQTDDVLVIGLKL